jgi:hypothetical protein
MRDSIFNRSFMRIAGAVDRRIGWYRLPKPLALVVLIGVRMTLRRHNLYDPAGTDVPWGPNPLPPGPRSLVRTIDGTGNDLNIAAMGSAETIFGRNVPIAETYPYGILEPNPRTISVELLARKKFIPATTLNVLAASWLQFEVHDWFSHGTNEPDDQFEVDLAPTDPWSFERPMRVERTKQGPPTIDGGPPTHRNTETHWWDASQVYGSTALVEQMLRVPGGKLKLTDDLVPFNPAELKFPPESGVDLAGVSGNWWVGLAMLHTLFMREHNAICDHLAAAHPEFTDDELYDHARLINAAQMAKIHTVEWTPSLLSNPVLQTAMRSNWWGLEGERLGRRFGRLSENEEVSGIPGSRTFHHGAPYAMTEEFVAVYRMHPLIPDDFEFRRVADNELMASHGFNELIGDDVDDMLRSVPMADLFYSFGISHPGAIVLHNYPNHLREFTRSDKVTIDLATYDILRSRERGVPRYNDFRRKFHLKPAATFEEISRDPGVVADLRRIYRDPEAVDLMIGLYAESPPKGFAFSDTAFRVFILMASRRLKSDRFFTYDYRPEVYTPEGMRWIEDSTMSAVLLRHYPELAPALRGVKNAFTPWNVA